MGGESSAILRPSENVLRNMRIVRRRVSSLRIYFEAVMEAMIAARVSSESACSVIKENE
jgi:hypothetical protein